MKIILRSKRSVVRNGGGGSKGGGGGGYAMPQQQAIAAAPVSDDTLKIAQEQAKNQALIEQGRKDRFKTGSSADETGAVIEEEQKKTLLGE